MTFRVSTNRRGCSHCRGVQGDCGRSDTSCEGFALRGWGTTGRVLQDLLHQLLEALRDGVVVVQTAEAATPSAAPVDRREALSHALRLRRRKASHSSGDDNQVECATNRARRHRRQGQPMADLLRSGARRAMIFFSWAISFSGGPLRSASSRVADAGYLAG